MKLKALVSFTGKVSMFMGEIREVADESIAADLIRAGYAVKYDDSKKGKKPEVVETPAKVEAAPETAKTPVETPAKAEDTPKKAKK